MDVETEIELEVRIDEAIAKIRSELEAGKEGAAPPESLDGTIGRLSRQDSLMQQEIAKDAQRRRTQRLYLLQQAAARIRDGSYGKCLSCEGEIAVARLMEIPEAPLCANCA